MVSKTCGSPTAWQSCMHWSYGECTSPGECIYCRRLDTAPTQVMWPKGWTTVVVDESDD
jgi:hypothetical protein